MKRCSLEPLIRLVLACGCFALAPASPAQGPADVREAWAAVDTALKGVAAYEFGNSRECLVAVTDAIRLTQDSPELRKELVEKLVAVLEGEATLAGKDFVCRQLAIIGTEDTVPILGAMLRSEETFSMARYALESMPYPAADAVLLNALGERSGISKVGVINSLGERRCAKAVAALEPLVLDREPMIATAAAIALGKIGGKDAAQALARLQQRAAPEVTGALERASLLLADKLRAEGKKEEAIAIYDRALKGAAPGHVRAAAFHGKVAALGDSAVALVAKALASGDADLVGAAAKCARELPGEAATAAFVERLPRMDPAGQVMLLSALTDRRDPAALDGVMELIASEDGGVRLAALDAIGELGNATCIEPLAGIAATSTDKEERARVRNTLDVLKGADVNGAMLALAQSSEAAIRIELIRSLGARGASSAVPALVEMAENTDEEEVRAALSNALARLATADELPVLIDLLYQSRAGGARERAQRAVLFAAKQIADEEQRVRAMLDGLARADSAAAKCSMYAVLAQVADEAYLGVLREATQGGDPTTKDAAIRALAGWPTATVADDLVRIAGDAEDQTHRVLALRGLVRLLRVSSELSVAQVLMYYEKAMDLAENVPERKMVLGGLAGVKSDAALTLVQACLSDAELSEEAALAAHTILFSRCSMLATHNWGDAGNAIDLNMDSRWSTGIPQEEGMSFGIGLDAEYEVRMVILDSTPSPDDFPRSYKVHVSNDPSDPHEPVAVGQGSGAVTKVEFAPKRGKFIMFVLAGVDPTAPWSIHELKFVDPETGDLGVAPIAKPAAE